MLIFDLFLLTTPSFLVIFILFARIIHKLSKMNRVGVTGNNMEMVGRGENVAPPTQTREKHVVAVKTFGAVTLCFLASYASAFIVRNGVLPLEAFYMYFLKRSGAIKEELIAPSHFHRNLKGDRLGEELSCT